MPINAGDSIKLSFIGSCFGQRIIMDLTYRCTVGNAGPTSLLLDELIDVVAPGGPAGNQIGDSYLACLPPQYALTSILAQVIWPIRSAYQEQTLAGVNGTNANAATVACDSAAITRRTAVAGRNQVSTLKIGPAPDGASANGLLTPAYVTLLGVLASRTLITQVMPVSTMQLVPTILSPTGVPGTRDLVSSRVGPESRVMRRRVVGRGI